MENRILRQIQFLKLYTAGLTLVFAALCFKGLSSSPAKQKSREIDIQRINIVDDQGKRQFVISNQGRFPDPIINGQKLKGMRSVKPAGLVFYDGKGNEAGGLVTSQTDRGKVSLVAFDYATGEAIDLGLEESDDRKKYSASFKIVDPPPPGTRIEEAGAKQQTRIAIRNENKDAQITLADADGKERIKLKVAADGAASIQILDHDGKVVLLRRNESDRTISSNQALQPTAQTALCFHVQRS